MGIGLPSGLNAAESHPNVLFIAIDDLRCNLGSCGESHAENNGYQTLALGKIPHHPGGLAGKEWAGTRGTPRRVGPLLGA